MSYKIKGSVIRDALQLFEARAFGAPIWAKFMITLSFLCTPIAPAPVAAAGARLIQSCGYGAHGHGVQGDQGDNTYIHG